MKREKSCSALLRILNIEMKKNFNREMKQYDLTGPQTEVLMYVLHHEKEKEINQKAIENSTGLSNPTVSGILNRLEEKKLIGRKVCERDARYKSINPTQNAKIIAEQICDLGRKADKKLVYGITEEELVIFKKVAEKMIHNLIRYRQEDSND